MSQEYIRITYKYVYWYVILVERNKNFYVQIVYSLSWHVFYYAKRN